MSSHKAQGRWIIWCSFFVALILQVMPWPEQLYVLQPNWLMLVLVYWVIALPHRVNIGTGFIIGLLWDLTTGSTLGVRALSLSIVTYLACFRFQLIRNMSLWQQALVIVGLTLVMDSIIFVIEFFVRNTIIFEKDILWGCLINGVLWPWLFLFLRRIRRRFGVK